MGRLRKRRSRVAGWSGSWSGDSEGWPPGRVRVGIAIPRRYAMPERPDESCAAKAGSEREVDERRDADRAEGVDHEEAARQREALSDHREAGEPGLDLAHRVLRHELARQHPTDREQEERGDEGRRPPRGEQSLKHGERGVER